MQQVPKILLATVAAQGLLLSWLWWHAYPRPTSDTVAFKQPAYMRLHGEYFSIPSYEGLAPDYNKVASYPACVYTYLNYLTFRAFGFSVYSSLGFDFAVHFCGSAIAAWCIWRMTRSELLASLLVVASIGWIDPIGRPEELGMFFALLALICVRTRYWFGSAIALGLTGATAPGTAIIGTVLVLLYDGFLSDFSRQFLLRSATIIVAAPALSIALYVAFVWPYLREAFEQHRYLTDSGFYFWTSPWALLNDPRLQGFTLCGLVVSAVALSTWSYTRAVGASPQDRATAFVKAAGIAIVFGMALNLIVGRRMYDYRFLMAVSFATVCLGSSLLQFGRERSRRLIATATFVWLLVLLPPTLRDVIRYAVAASLWTDTSIDYAQAVEAVHELVPPSASLGGTGECWTIVDDGRPYLATRFIDREFWPDYVIGTTWSKPPSLFQYSAKLLEDSYVEITPEPQLPQDGCSLRLLGIELPVATGRCDWYLRVWKRRDDAPRRAPAP